MKRFGPIGNARKNARPRDSRTEQQALAGLGIPGCRQNFFARMKFRSDLQHIVPLDLRLHQNVFDECRDLAFSLGRRGGRDRELALRPRQRHIEQPPFFLNVKISGGQLFLHQ